MRGFRKNQFVHPNARPDLIAKSEEHVRAVLSEGEAEAYLNPHPHPELEGYLLDNAGSDATPVRVKVLTGTIHEPDGTPRVAGDPMILPKYIADPWIQEKRIERA